jgi:hypothetical protein
MKKESRMARIEALPRGGALIIIFRGGWIDGLSAFPGGEIQGDVAGWLDRSRYSEELRGISIGSGLGEEETKGLKAWARSKGIKEVEIVGRNKRQSQVLLDGFRQLLSGKG